MSTSLDAATVDLLGVLAYGELTAFERLASALTAGQWIQAC